MSEYEKRRAHTRTKSPYVQHSPLSFTLLVDDVRRPADVDADRPSPPLRDLVDPDLTVQEAQPVGQQTGAAARLHRRLTVGHAAPRGPEVDLQHLEVPVAVVHVLQADDAVQAKLRHHLLDVIDDGVVEIEQLKRRRLLLTNDPLQEFPLVAERIHAQLGTVELLHDEGALRTGRRLLILQELLVGLEADTTTVEVGDEIRLHRHLDVTGPVDASGRLGTDDRHAVHESPFDFGVRCRRTDGLDPFGTNRIVAQHLLGEDDLVVDDLEVVRGRNGVDLTGVHPHHGNGRQRERPERGELPLRDQGVQLSGCQLRLLLERRQTERRQPQPLLHLVDLRLRDEERDGDFRTFRDPLDAVEAVAVAQQNGHCLPLFWRLSWVQSVMRTVVNEHY